MKFQQIIDNYCRLHGTTTPKLDLKQTQYFITICADGSRVLPLHQSSQILGKIVSAALKRGTVLYVKNNWVTPITWENWKETWNALFAPKERKNNAPKPNRVRPYKSEIFELMQTKRRYKKPQKCGFQRAENATRGMDLLATPTFTREAIS